MKKLDKSLLALLLTGLAVAGFQSQASADGFYFGGGAYLTEASTTSFDDTDETLGLFIGYHLVDSNIFLLSAELGSYDLGNYSEDGNKIDADALSLSVNAGIPLGPFLELYGKIGAADVSVTVNNEDFDGSEAFYGVGMAFDFFDTVDIYLEYLQFDTEVNSEMIGAGIKLDLF